MRKVVPTAVAAVVWWWGAGAALAHVTVNPREAAQGSYAAFTVRVPNERPAASTVKVDLALPEERPIESVSVQPVPGWDHSVAKRRLPEPLVDEHGNRTEEVVASITWTPQPGVAIRPGEFMQFPVSLGPLPSDQDRLVFRSVQTYDNGEVVRWIEVSEEGAAEPEHPAPVVRLVAGDEHGRTAGEPAATVPGDGGSDARSTAAIVIALVAAALSVGALVGGRGATERA